VSWYCCINTLVFTPAVDAADSPLEHLRQCSWDAFIPAQILVYQPCDVRSGLLPQSRCFLV
jgi:hypothetical protein